MLCWKRSTKNDPRGTPVYINVYDLSTINLYTYWLGIGIYHSGIEVDGVEYCFGGTGVEQRSGIFELTPKNFNGLKLRRSILIGWTDMSGDEVRKLMIKLGKEYKGASYNIISKNCNHFCNDVCARLTGKKIPKWVNRLARIGDNLNIKVEIQT